MPAPIRSTTNRMLELEGVDVGRPRSIEGGEPTATVVSERDGGDSIVRKHLGRVTYDDIVVEFGPELAAPFTDWIARTLERTFEAKSGAIVTAGSDGKIRSRTTFERALVSSIAFPTVDAASKDAATMTVSLSPASTRRAAAAGDLQIGAGAKQKVWLQANFRLSIDGLDCKRAIRVQPPAVRVTVADFAEGDRRDVEHLAMGLEISDLVVTFAETDAASWDAWFDDFVVAGNNGSNREKAGTLELLSPDLKTTLLTLSLSGLGIFRLHREDRPAGGEHGDRVTASMYCEDVRLSVGPAKPKPAAGRPVRLDPILDRPEIRLPN